jgi:hypothetical protein
MYRLMSPAAGGTMEKSSASCPQNGDAIRRARID